MKAGSFSPLLSCASTRGAAFALLFASACAQPAAETGSVDAGAIDRAPQVETLVLEPRRFVERIEVTGATEALQDAILSAQSSGTVQDLAPLGASARKGKVLARLDPGLLQAGVRQAKATVEAARASSALAQESFDRQKPLYDGKIISALEFRKIRSDLASAKAQLAQAEASLAQAMKGLTNTLVIAPFAGVVEVRMVKEGEQVAPGAQIVRLINSQIMKIKAGVPERYAADIKVGREVSVRFNAYGIAERNAKLSFVSSVIDPRSRTFEVEAQLTNRDAVLKPEMVARVVIDKAVIDKALVIPITCVIRDEQGTSVFVVERSDGLPVARQRSIELGVASSGDVVVASGLSAGDEVVVLGQTDLTRGDIVRITRQRDAQARTP